MPFGLINISAIYQSQINQLLYDILDIYIIVYLDNILIYLEEYREYIK